MSPAPPGSQPTNYRWVVCALLFAATTINYVDRQILALIKPILDEQLQWTNEQYALTTSCFSAAYAVSLLGFGWFVDRVGTKLGYAVSIMAWSLAALAHTLVGSIAGFYAVRVALGLGEGGNFPAAIKAVALWFPKKERAFATAIFNSGANAGAIIAPLLVPVIALTWGWRWAFALAGLAGFLWLLLWLPFYDAPGKLKAVNAAELRLIGHGRDEPGADGAPVPWSTLLGYRQTWSFVVAKGLTDPVWWFFLIWLPDFFKKTRHLDIKSSALLVAVIYGLATALSIGGSWAVGALNSRGWSANRARKTGLLVFACGVLPIVLVKDAGNWTAVLLIGFACAAHQAWSANLFTSVSDMFPRRAVASVVGLGSMVGAGMNIVFPLVAGRLLDRFSAQGNIAGGYALLFAGCASAYLVAFAVQHLLAPRFEMIALPSP